MILQSIRGGCWFFEAAPKITHFLTVEKFQKDDDSSVGILDFEPTMVWN